LGSEGIAPCIRWLIHWEYSQSKRV